MTERHFSKSVQTTYAEEFRKKYDQSKNGAKLCFVDPVRRQYSHPGQSFAIDSSSKMHFNVPIKLIYHKLNLRLFNQ